MLIIVPKCISTFSSQVILNDVRYLKRHQHHRRQRSCKSVTVVTRQHDLSCAYLKSEWRPIFSGARSFSTLRVKVVLRRPFGLFHPAAVSLLPPAKLSNNHSLEEPLETWPNKYNWFEWVMSPNKQKHWFENTPVGSNCSLFLNSVPLFQKCSKVPTEKYGFPTTKNILDFF